MKNRALSIFIVAISALSLALGQSFNISSKVIVQAGDTVTHAYNNDQSNTVLLFTNSAAFYYINLNGATYPLNANAITATRFNVSALGAPAGEIISGGYVETQGTTDTLYLFGTNVLYETTTANPPSVTPYTYTPGFSNAWTGAVSGSSLFIPSGPGSSNGNVAVFDLTAKTFGTAVSTSNVEGTDDIFLRSDDTFVLRGPRGGGGQFDFRTTAFAAAAAPRTFSNYGQATANRFPGRNTGYMSSGDQYREYDFSLSTLGSTEGDVSSLPVLSGTSSGAFAAFFTSARFAQLAVVFGASQLTSVAPFDNADNGLSSPPQQQALLTSSSNITGLTGALLSVNGTQNVFFDQTTAYVVNGYGCTTNCNFPNGVCSTFNFKRPTRVTCNCAPGFTDDFCQTATSATTSSSTSSTSTSSTFTTSTFTIGSTTSQTAVTGGSNSASAILVSASLAMMIIASIF